jgi:hypothetical protein
MMKPPGTQSDFTRTASSCRIVACRDGRFVDESEAVTEGIRGVETSMCMKRKCPQRSQFRQGHEGMSNSPQQPDSYRSSSVGT